MHIDWGCKNNAADEDCNKCMIFGIIMDCPYNCPYCDMDYVKARKELVSEFRGAKDDIDQQRGNY